MNLNKRNIFTLVVGFTTISACWSHTTVHAADRSELYFNLTAKFYPIGVSMLLTSPSGQRTGENLPANLSLHEIPNSDLMHDGPSDDVTSEAQPQSMTVGVRRPPAGLYRLSVFASTSTAFYLIVDSRDSTRTRTSVNLQGTIARGSTQEFTINYSPAPGSLPVIRPVLNTTPLSQNSLASCGDISLAGHTSAAGPVRANGSVNLSGDAVINGDATAAAVNMAGHSSVTGQITRSSESLDCFPADLAAALQLLTASNDNANIPAGFLNAGVLRITGTNALTLASGDYLVDRLEMSGGSRLVASGPVRVFVRQSADLAGQAVAGSAAAPLTIFSNTTGALSSSGSAELHAILYAPTAKINLSGQARIIGRVHVADVNMTGAAKVEAP